MAKNNKQSLKNFNPLAPTPVVTKNNEPMETEKAVRDLIK
jgi:hypothetical protein